MHQVMRDMLFRSRGCYLTPPGPCTCLLWCHCRRNPTYSNTIPGIKTIDIDSLILEDFRTKSPLRSILSDCFVKAWSFIIFKLCWLTIANQMEQFRSRSRPPDLHSLQHAISKFLWLARSHGIFQDSISGICTKLSCISTPSAWVNSYWFFLRVVISHLAHPSYPMLHLQECGLYITKPNYQASSVHEFGRWFTSCASQNMIIGQYSVLNRKEKWRESCITSGCQRTREINNFFKKNCGSSDSWFEECNPRLDRGRPTGGEKPEKVLGWVGDEIRAG